MVIFGNGAKNPDSYGVAMWITKGRMYLRVSTKTKEWTLTTTKFTVKQFINIKFSWSVQTGEFDFLSNWLY